MSSELYEVLALAARYLFALLGILIVLRAFLWLLADRQDRHHRLRRLPDAGMIGEMVVLSGSRELPEGVSLPVPWEGVLGSVRSCDVIVPCPGVRKRHLRFSFIPNEGLRILPESGCEAAVDDTVLDCRSGKTPIRMHHGSFLRVGSALLRLRVFAGLDPSAGFEDDPAGPEAVPGYGPAPYDPYGSYDPSAAPVPTQEGIPFPGNDDALQPGAPLPEGYPAGDFQPGDSLPDGPAPAEGGLTGAEGAPAGRKRHADRWEADWSE